MYKYLETLVNTAFVDIQNICSSVRERLLLRIVLIEHKQTTTKDSD